MIRLLTFATVLLILACQSASPLPEPPAADPSPEAIGAETAIGTVRVTASRLNVRSAPSTNDAVVTTIRRGQRAELLATAAGWSRIRLSGGEVGWVASRYVREDKGCPADRPFEIVESPMMSFSDSGAHGVVVIEARVNASGKVTSTKLVSNETGDPTLAELAASEIRRAEFRAPVVNCVTRAFIYTHRRAF